MSSLPTIHPFNTAFLEMMITCDKERPVFRAHLTFGVGLFQKQIKKHSHCELWTVVIAYYYTTVDGAEKSAF